MSPPLGITICGCAHIHMPDVVRVLADRDDVDCVGIWDGDEARMEAWGARLGAPSLSGVQAIGKRSDIAAVLILSETCHHESLVTAATAAGKHVFVEKPLATTGPAARRLAARIENSPGCFHTGYFLRDVPAYRSLRRMIRDGHLGGVRRASAQLSHDGAHRGVFDEYPWHLDRDQAGYGGFGDLGIHLVDLLTWLLDEPVEAVRASVGTTGRTRAHDEFGEGTLRFVGGALAELRAGWTERQSQVSLTVTGARGTAVVAGGRLRVDGEDLPLLAPPEPVAPSAGTAVALFIDLVTGRAVPGEVSPVVAASHCEVVDAMYRSARELGWIDV